MDDEYRIWYKQYDEFGRCCGTGVSTRSYKNKEAAERVAIGMYYDLPIKWVVSKADPFAPAESLSKKYRTVCLA